MLQKWNFWGFVSRVVCLCWSEISSADSHTWTTCMLLVNLQAHVRIIANFITVLDASRFWQNGMDKARVCKLHIHYLADARVPSTQDELFLTEVTLVIARLQDGSEQKSILLCIMLIWKWRAFSLLASWMHYLLIILIVLCHRFGSENETLLNKPCRYRCWQNIYSPVILLNRNKV